MSDRDTALLFRPVGQAEFPPRLSYQPISHPVLSRSYAEQIARDWNTKDPRSGYIGYVTRFRVRVDFLERYSVLTVGGSDHQEYQITAEDLARFNNNNVGGFRVVRQFET